MAIPTNQPDRATKLRQIIKLLSTAAANLISDWDNGSPGAVDASSIGGGYLPSLTAHHAERTMVAAMGSLRELISSPAVILAELNSAYYPSRALHIAAKLRVADVLLEAGEKGLHVEKIAQSVRVERVKIVRVLRCLASHHVFREVASNVFANNAVSMALTNEHQRSLVLVHENIMFAAAENLPSSFTDPICGPSSSPDQTAFSMGVGCNVSVWEWLNQQVPSSELREYRLKAYVPPTSNGSTNGSQNGNGTREKHLCPRPDAEIFNKAMVGGGRIIGTSHVFDYPWKPLGKATMVDVGGGVGGFELQLAKMYPDLQFIVQDRPPVIQQAISFWEHENPKALVTGKTQLMPHDFFDKNPVQGADVYFMRLVLHSWADERATKILANIAESMGQHSRLLVAERVIVPSFGCDELESAPAPLLPNYGLHNKQNHANDLGSVALLNGMERTPAEFRHIIEAAGLRMVKIWECRSALSILECRLH